MSGSFRLSYRECRDLLVRRLAEPASGRIQLLSGPRQVGKTTLLLDLAERLGPAALYAAGDSPDASLPGFWERLWARAEGAAARGPAFLFIDEAHLVPDWAARLKGEWDRLRRRRLPIHVVATGSAALRLGRGSRESLAGRFERLTLTHWSASSVAEVFGLSPAEAADIVVGVGSYPGALPLRGIPIGGPPMSGTRSSSPPLAAISWRSRPSGSRRSSARYSASPSPRRRRSSPSRRSRASSRNGARSRPSPTI